jgi:hypothetical protein
MVLKVVNADGMIMAAGGDKVRTLRKRLSSVPEFSKIAEFSKREAVEIFRP